MLLKFEKGALNLVWVAIISALVALVAMAALYSMRYERNVFAEAWEKFTSLFRQAQLATGVSVSVGTPTLYKCTVNGKVLYSNVACDAKDPASTKVDIQNTSGFEAPKVPVSSAPEVAPPTLQDKIIEKATRPHQ